MLRKAAVGALLVASGCGRLGFDPLAGADGGAPAAPDAEVCVPAAEICNGLDDDCDGLVDEGCPCETGAIVLVGMTTVAADPGLVWTGESFMMLFTPASEASPRLATLTPEGMGSTIGDQIGDGRTAPVSGPAMAWNGDALAVALLAEAGTEVHVATFDRDGLQLSDWQPAAVAAGQVTSATILSDGDGWDLAWVDFGFTEGELYARKLGGDGTPAGTVARVSDGSAPAFRGHITRTAAGYLAYWVVRESGSDHRLLLRALDRSLTPIRDPIVREEIVQATLGRAARNRDEVGLPWAHRPSGPLMFERLDDRGEVLASAEVTASTSSAYSSAVWTGESYGVVWTGGPGGAQVRFQELDAAGTPVGPPLDLSGQTETPYTVSGASLVAAAGRFAVAFVAGAVGAPDVYLQQLCQ